MNRSCKSLVTATNRSRSGWVASIRRTSAMNSSASKTWSINASKSSSLDEKARKIVPSAIPAASAIMRVVVAVPCSITRGRATSRIAARRSSGDIGQRVRLMSAEAN